jgi:hypothetical protein
MKLDHNMDPDSFDDVSFFKWHDIDSDGYLDRRELEMMYHGMDDEEHMTPKEKYEMRLVIDQVIAEADKNHDGLVSLQEFLKTLEEEDQFEHYDDHDHDHHHYDYDHHDNSHNHYYKENPQAKVEKFEHAHENHHKVYEYPQTLGDRLLMFQADLLADNPARFMASYPPAAAPSSATPMLKAEPQNIPSKYRT